MSSKGKALNKWKETSGKKMRAEHEKFDKEGKTAMKYPAMRTYMKHLEKTGKLEKTKYV